MKTIFNRMYGLLVAPTEEWRKIGDSSYDIASVRQRFILPLVLFLVVCSIWGAMGSVEEGETSRFVAVLRVVAEVGGIAFVSYFAGFYLSVLLCAEWFSRSVGLVYDYDRTFKLIAHASFIMWCVKGIVAVFPDFFVLYIANFYAAYMIWEAAPVLFPEMDGAMRSRFMFGSFLLIYMVPFVIERGMLFMMS